MNQLGRQHRRPDGWVYPTQEEVLRLLDYSPATGMVRRRVTAGGAVAGSVAGYISNQGYRHIRVAGHSYPAGVLIWVMMTGEWPDRLVDHIETDGPKADWGNRWSNLRLATNAQNCRNKTFPRPSSSGHTGVYWYAESRKWRAEIGFNNKRIKLGYFATVEEAVRAREQAEAAYFGEFAPQRVAS